MRREVDFSGALRWAGEPASAACRGRRLTALQVALLGPTAIDGARSITRAAKARGVAHATMIDLLAVLRERFGLEPQPAPLAFPKKHISGEVYAAEPAETDWNLPMDDDEKPTDARPFLNR